MNIIAAVNTKNTAIVTMKKNMDMSTIIMEDMAAVVVLTLMITRILMSMSTTITRVVADVAVGTIMIMAENRGGGAFFCMSLGR